MAWKLDLIDQGAALRRHAQAHSDGANEAYLVVHGVLARKFAHDAATQPSACADLKTALAHAETLTPLAA